ncbi:hypothetical protein OEZ86_005907 [Tetradesmus obliquus]|nr:hypothetical protein OEZ86_005907 [Tetradesmus obliquus]
MDPYLYAGVNREQEALATLRRLSKASLELFDSQPELSSTVIIWLNQRLKRDDASELCDEAGVASLISNQQVVQLLSAALTTLVNGFAEATADVCLPQNRLLAFQDLCSSFHLCITACTEIWAEASSSSSGGSGSSSSRDQQERQKAALQAAKPGLFPAIAAACETEATILQQLREQYKQQEPGQQRSQRNAVVRLLKQHLILADQLLWVWALAAHASPAAARFSAAFVPVAVPLADMAMQLLLACSAVTATISSNCGSSSSSNSSSASDASRSSEDYFKDPNIVIAAIHGACRSMIAVVTKKQSQRAQQ